MIHHGEVSRGRPEYGQGVRSSESDTLDGQERHVRDGDPKRERSVGEKRSDPGEVLSALADEQRRAVLRSLDRGDGDASDLDVLIDTIREENAPADVERREVQTRLRHVDLPKLEAAGLIEYDADGGRIRSVEGTFTQRLRSVVDEYEAENHSA